MRGEFPSNSVIISTPMAYKEKCRMWLSTPYETLYELNLNSVSIKLYEV